MLVFWKQKLILFAVPKTGTTALEAALAPRADISILNPPGLKHCNVQRYDRHLAPTFERGNDALTRVALIREPMDWLSSWYRYRARPAIKGRASSTAEISFEDFVEAWLMEKPPAFAQLGSQAKFLINADGHLGVDHLFRYETIDAARVFLEAKLGLEIQLEPHNVSPKASVEITPALRSTVMAARPRDFALWEMADTGAN